MARQSQEIAELSALGRRHNLFVLFAWSHKNVLSKVGRTITSILPWYVLLFIIARTNEVITKINVFKGKK